MESIQQVGEVITTDIADVDDSASKSITNGVDEAFDAGTLALRVLDQKGISLNEKWDHIDTIHGIIRTVSVHAITVECMIDRDSLEFELNTFPRSLFTNLGEPLHGKPIILRLSTKPGSSRIDIVDGAGIISLENFQFRDDIADLEDANLDKPFDLNND